MVGRDHRRMLLAEDLLLLLLDDEKGTTPSLWVDIRVPLGAAVLAELALDGAVEPEAPASRWRSTTIGSTGRSDGDEVLAAALAIVAEKPRTAVDLAKRIGDGQKQRLADRLAAAGLVERQDDRVLGLFPRTRWPATSASHEAAVRDEIGRVLLQGAAPGPRVAALIGLLAALDRIPATLGVRGDEARAAKRRAKELSRQDWASKAVRDAVEAAVTAVVTTSVVSGTVATTSS